ncbi:DUF349 domain-containing protein [uncultured Microbacterium sp.]|uniref:DUF349 domain-containing protein n=1 Tax=uncultured Microbacterium sp. TaxID=191216 RepID=UPI0025F71FD4|nr:DUF349 domain-containing protein [uncultured Microbacterium sp.]
MSDESVSPIPSETESEGAAERTIAVETTWGRVTDDGVVSVREGDDWRVVGEYPDGTPEEALGYFTRKYADLAGEVTLLEQRFKRAGTSPQGLVGTARALGKKITATAAVGDLASLTARVEALSGVLAEASQEEKAAAAEALQSAIAEREAIVVSVEKLAARDPQTVQWKQTTADLNALFAEWQTHQNDGPRLPRAQSQELWKRFRDARATIEKHRREFFAGLDETHRGARDAKTRLVERAEALSASADDQVAAYRSLLDEWKAAGRAGKKVDDALWARFKAAGDAVFQARTDRDAEAAAEAAPKVAEKQELVEKAREIVQLDDLTRARTELTAVQRRWDEIGRIPSRDQERPLEDAMRKAEQSLRAREDEEWKRSNPETKARAGDMARQLAEAISRLEGELAAAEAKKDARAIAKISGELETRRSWLAVIGD